MALSKRTRIALMIHCALKALVFTAAAAMHWRGVL